MANLTDDATDEQPQPDEQQQAAASQNGGIDFSVPTPDAPPPPDFSVPPPIRQGGNQTADGSLDFSSWDSAPMAPTPQIWDASQYAQAWQQPPVAPVNNAPSYNDDLFGGQPPADTAPGWLPGPAVSWLPYDAGQQANNAPTGDTAVNWLPYDGGPTDLGDVRLLGYHARDDASDQHALARVDNSYDYASYAPPPPAPVDFSPLGMPQDTNGSMTSGGDLALLGSPQDANGSLANVHPVSTDEYGHVVLNPVVDEPNDHPVRHGSFWDRFAAQPGPHDHTGDQQDPYAIRGGDGSYHGDSMYGADYNPHVGGFSPAEMAALQQGDLATTQGEQTDNLDQQAALWQHVSDTGGTSPAVPVNPTIPNAAAPGPDDHPLNALLGNAVASARLQAEAGLNPNTQLPTMDNWNQHVYNYNPAEGPGGDYGRFSQENLNVLGTAAAQANPTAIKQLQDMGFTIPQQLVDASNGKFGSNPQTGLPFRSAVEAQAWADAMGGATGGGGGGRGSRGAGGGNLAMTDYEKGQLDLARERLELDKQAKEASHQDALSRAFQAYRTSLLDFLKTPGHKYAGQLLEHGWLPGQGGPATRAPIDPMVLEYLQQHPGAGEVPTNVAPSIGPDASLAPMLTNQFSPVTLSAQQATALGKNPEQSDYASWVNDMTPYDLQQILAGTTRENNQQDLKAPVKFQ